MRYCHLECGTVIQWSLGMTLMLQDLASAVTSQNEPKLRSHNITEPIIYKAIRVLDGTIYERRITCHLNVEQ